MAAGTSSPSARPAQRGGARARVRVMRRTFPGRAQRSLNGVEYAREPARECGVSDPGAARGAHRRAHGRAGGPAPAAAAGGAAAGGARAAAPRAADRRDLGRGAAGLGAACGRGLRQPPARRAGRRRRSPAGRARAMRRRRRRTRGASRSSRSGEPAEAQLAEALALWRGPVLADLAYEGSLRTEIARLRGAAARGARAARRADGCSAAATREALADLQALVAARAVARARARPADARALPRGPPGRGARGLPRRARAAGRGAGARAGRAAARAAGGDPAPRPGARRPRRAPARATCPRRRRRWSGASAEIEELAALLRGAARLVTLTGPGGTGKTRLALAAAEALLDDFADGAHFVDLSALRDPATVAPADRPRARARRRGRPRAAAARPPRCCSCSTTSSRCSTRRRAVGALLAGAPGVRVLATSRTRLDLYGEHEFAVDPLDAGRGRRAVLRPRPRARPRASIPTRRGGRRGGARSSACRWRSSSSPRAPTG